MSPPAAANLGHSEIAASFLERYGYNSKDGVHWTALPGEGEVRLELHVNGHCEVERHTCYAIECRLVLDGLRQLEWKAQRRLLSLREQLHDPVKKQLGVTYDQVFSGAPFAHHGAPIGTTARLGRWCKVLAESVNAGVCPPSVVTMLLRFLDVPQPPEPPKPKAESSLLRPDSGLALFQARRRLSEHQEKVEARAPVLAESSLALAVESLENGQYKLHGIPEDIVLKSALRHLEGLWCPKDDLTELPQQDRRRLLKGNLILSLLKRERDLKSMPMGDVSAAQGDLKHLSLRQLLRIRVWLLDYEPQRQAGSVVAQVGNAHAAFMNSLDSLLFQRLGEAALAGIEAVLPGVPGVSHRLGVELALIIAAAQALTSSAVVRWWVWWLDTRRVFFDAEQFLLLESFPSEGALQVVEKSRVDSRFDGHRRRFEWIVTHIGEEHLLRAIRVAETADPC